MCQHLQVPLGLSGRLTASAALPLPSFPGVASNWLARTKKGASVPVFVRRSTFKLPASPATPVVMVGPGTGLAPFRGFVQERAALAKSGKWAWREAGGCIV